MGGDCTVCLSIFGYGLPQAESAFGRLQPQATLESVLSYDTLIEVGRANGHISDADLEKLVEWKSDPFNWGDKHGFPKVEKK